MPAIASADRATPALAPLLCAGLVLATVVVFWTATACGFINFDDPDYVTQNPAVRAGLGFAGLKYAFSVGHTGNWIPLTWLSHMLDVSLFGLDPAYHHLHSVVLHALNVALLFLALRGYARHALPEADESGLALACAVVAGVFALHPLRLESVVWISERKDVLAGTFWLATLSAWLRYARRPGPGTYGPVAVFLALGLMSKPMLVSLPLILLLMDAWPLQRLFDGVGRIRRGVVLEKIPLAVLAAGSAALTVVAQAREGAVSGTAVVSPALRVVNAGVAYAGYLGDLVWPVGLAVFYPLPLEGWPTWQVVVSFAALVAITALAIRERRRHPWIAVGWLWYLVSALPVIGLVRVGQQASADRYTYLPSIGPTVVLVWALALAARRWAVPRAATVAAAGVVLIALAASTRAQIGYWRDSISLFGRALEVTEGNHVAHYSLSLAYAERGELEQALVHGHEAVWIYPQQYEAYLHVADLHLQRGEFDDAQFFLGLAMRQDRDAAPAWLGLGRVLLAERRSVEAVAAFEEAVARAPRAAEAHYNLGVANERLGQVPAALEAYTAAADLDPGDYEKWLALARTATLGGNEERAMDALRRAIGIKPDDPRAQKRMAMLFIARGELARAEEIREVLVGLEDPGGARQVQQRIEAARRRAP